MTERIEILTNYLSVCDVLADVGCDHGYCALYAIEKRLCKRAIVTDISAQCLAKAEELLKYYIRDGRVTALCTDGLHGLDENVSQIVIAGMGGRKIIQILEEGFIPEKFVFQPMKNSPELRAYLIGKGCKLTRDDVFYSKGKYYFVVCGEREGGVQPAYSDDELFFGRDSLNNDLLKRYAEKELKKREGYLENCKLSNYSWRLLQNIERFKGVLK